MSTGYKPTDGDKQKYLEYLKNKGVSKTPDSITDNLSFDYIDSLASKINERWNSKYDYEELYGMVSDQLFFNPIESIVTGEPNNLFSPYFIGALEQSQDVNEFYGNSLLEMYTNKAMFDLFKSKVLSNYLQLCLEFGVESDLKTLTIFTQ